MGAGEPSLANAVVEPPDGNKGQAAFLAMIAKPDAAPSLLDKVIEQPCLPSRRQQAGSFDSGRADSSGSIISGKLKATNSKIA